MLKVKNIKTNFAKRKAKKGLKYPIQYAIINGLQVIATIFSFKDK